MLERLVQKYGPEPGAGGAAAARPAQPPSAAAASPYRARFVAFYQQHDPSKLPNVEKLLDKYRGQELTLFDMLNAKYADHL